MLTKFQQSEGLHLTDFNKEKGYMAFLDTSFKPHLVYSAPSLEYGETTIWPNVDFSASSSELSIDIPNEVTFPLALSFELGTKYPSAEGKGFFNKMLSKKSKDQEASGSKQKGALKVFITMCRYVELF
jgi:hypothetical protein